MPVTFHLDHVVIRVNDLDAAIRDYTELGFTVVPGGEHPGLGSRNALIAFEDGSYLELITFRNSESRRLMPKHVRARELAASEHTPMERHWLAWESAPEGLVDFALRPSSIDTAIREAASRGLKLEGPIPGGRTRPDGKRVSWQMALPDSFDLPFLCADVTPRSLRVPEGDARRHENGAVGILSVQVAVRDLTASASRYCALLGEDSFKLDEQSTESTFLAGESSVGLATPRQPSDYGFDRLSACGEGPFFLLLGWRGLNLQTLDPTRTHGAEIDLLPR